MLLSTVFEQLFHVELSQTAIGKGAADALTVMNIANYPKMINHVNLGVLALHKRFALMEKEIVIQQNDGISTYQFDNDYAYTNDDSDEAIKYLIDTTADPFDSAKFLQVLGVYAEEGIEYLLNPAYVEASLESVYVAYNPTPESIQFPYPSSDNAVFVVYKAAPLDIATTTSALAAATTKVRIPEVLFEALLAFITDRFLGSMKKDKSENVAYTNKFEIECKRIIDQNLLPTEHLYSSNRFRRNGWR